MKYSNQILYTLFLVVVCNHNLLAADTLFLSNNNSDYPIEDYVSVLIDSNRTYSIEKIFNKDSKFVKSNKLNFSWTDLDYWLRFDIKNIQQKDADLFFIIPYPVIDEIDFYETSERLINKVIHTGEVRSFYNREIFNQNYLFSIKLKPGESKTYYLRINNNGDTLFIPMQLKNKNAIFISNNVQSFLDALFYGLFIFIFIFNIYLFIKLRKRVYLFYPLYIIFAIIFFLAIDGYSSMFFWPENSWISNYSIPIGMGFACIFINLFAINFLSLKLNLPRFHIILRFLIILFAITDVLIFIKPTFLFALETVSYLTLVTYFLLPLISLILVLRRFKPSYYFFIGTVVWLLGLILYSARDFGILPDSFFAANGIKLGFSTEGIALSLAVIDYFRREKDDANKQLKKQNLQIERQSDTLQTQNEELKKLSVVASRTDNSIAIFDNNGIIEWYNDRFKSLHGFENNKYPQDIGISISMIFKHKDIKKFLDLCRDNHETVIFENIINASTHSVYTQTTLTPLLENNKLEKLIAIDSDITTIKKYEKKLIKSIYKAEESDRLKTAFLANMSHEIRTPMNAILGFSFLLKRSNLTSEKKEEYISVIDSNTKDLLKLMDDILDISKIESRQTEIVYEYFSLNDLVKNLYSTFLNDRKRIEKEHISLILIENTELNIPILTDYAKIKQILSNLISNAFKYMKKGSIEFGYNIKNNNIIFFVKDTGIGIDEKNSKKIFKRFQKVESADTDILHRGIGLGLAISKNFVEALNGKIWFDSVVNEGSTFYFSIPLITQDTKDDDDKTTETFQNTGSINWLNKTILIAEDNKSNFNLLVEMLAPTNATIIRAKDGVEVITKFNTLHPDLIIMDIQMPNKNGYEATKEIRKTSQIPIIALTAYAQYGEREVSIKTGCDHYISKPLEYEELISALKKLI